VRRRDAPASPRTYHHLTACRVGAARSILGRPGTYSCVLVHFAPRALSRRVPCLLAPRSLCLSVLVGVVSGLAAVGSVVGTTQKRYRQAAHAACQPELACQLLGRAPPSRRTAGPFAEIWGAVCNINVLGL
jgi:hypothetical protein